MYYPQNHSMKYSSHGILPFPRPLKLNIQSILELVLGYDIRKLLMNHFWFIFHSHIMKTLRLMMRIIYLHILLAKYFTGGWIKRKIKNNTKKYLLTRIVNNISNSRFL